MSKEKYRKIRRLHGFLLVEIVVAISLVALMAALAGKAIVDYNKSWAIDQAHRIAAAAAAAQLQRYQAGAPLDSQPPPNVIDKDVALETSRVDGQGQWAGFYRVTVTARATDRQPPVQVSVSGYVHGEGQP